MKNIHVLPTNKPSRLCKSKITQKLSMSDVLSFYGDGTYNQHIYITNDDKIKEGDRDFYIIANDRDKTWINRIEKVIESKIDPKHGKVLILSSGFIYIDEGCKIILTTDPGLIKDGVQEIDDTFLEWFVKNPSCEKVIVEIDYNKWKKGNITISNCYEIIIPKEEPKQTVEQYEQQGLEKYAYEFQQETPEEAGKRVSELVDAMDSNMEMFSITNQIDELGYAVSNMRDIIHEIVKILDVK
jgi:hypothetical protein